MSNAEELNGEVRGFSGIFTDRYEGFTERTVDELYRIAVNIENSDKYAAASKILKEIYKHLDGEYTHDFKLNSTDILNQLYQTYVDAGYDKSKDEFIEDVSKNIQIGTTEDIAAGINDTKAVDSVAWRRYWLEHLKSLGAHINIRNSISPNQCVNSYPIFYFDSNSQRHMKPTYHLTDKWNSDGMTMVFKYTGETGEVFRISFGSGDLIVECDDTNLVVKFADTTLCSISHTELNVYTYVLVCTPKEVVVRNELDRVSVKTDSIILDSDDISSTDGWVLPSDATTLQFTDIIHSSQDPLSEFSMYNFPVKAEEEIFFVN